MGRFLGFDNRDHARDSVQLFNEIVGTPNSSFQDVDLGAARINRLPWATAVTHTDKIRSVFGASLPTGFLVAQEIPSKVNLRS